MLKEASDTRNKDAEQALDVLVNQLSNMLELKATGLIT